MKVYCITNSFIGPQNESAANNRLKLLAEGFRNNDIEIQICSFYYGNHKSKLITILNLLKKFLFSLYLIFKIKKTDVLYVYGEFIIFSYIVCCVHLKGTRIIFERTEYPQNILCPHLNSRHNYLLNYYLKSLKYANYFVTCSEALIKYYQNFTQPHCHFFNIPLLVNSPAVILGKRDKAIVYCGYMGKNKDGLPDLIKAFSLLDEKFRDFKLILIGYAEDGEINFLKGLVHSLNLKDRVCFTGKLSHQDTLTKLTQASVLVLARPDNKQAEGGFPSKLGEYLATGIPVLVTKVGDIPLYIKDEKNGFLANPDDPQDFGAKLNHILDHYEFAIEVGKQGQKFVKQFIPKEQIKKIITQLNSIE